MATSLRQPKGFYRGVFALMIPIVLQNIIAQTVTLSDTFMVGILGEQYLAAATMAATPLFIFMLFTFGVHSGAGILVAQYWGKGNTNAINRILGIALYCNVAVTLIGAVVMFSFPHQILNLVTNDKTLVELGAGYAKIVSVAQLLSAVSQTYMACQRSMENAKLGLVVLSVSSVFNVFGNWVLIFGKFGLPALGIEGAALATLLARALEVVVVVIHAFMNKRFRVKLSLLVRPGVVILRDFVKYSLPVLLNESLWGFGAMLYPVILGHMDGAKTILAAYTIAGNIERLFSVSVIACGASTAVIIGREIGAGHTAERLQSISAALVRLGTILGLSSGILLMLARFTLIEPLVFPLFDLSQGAMDTAATMLVILAVAVPLRTLAFTSGVGILRGGGDVKVLMYIDVGSLYFLALPIAAISGLILKADIAVVYSSVLIEDLIKAVFCLIRVKSGKWINNVTRDDTEIA